MHAKIITEFMNKNIVNNLNSKMYFFLDVLMLVLLANLKIIEEMVERMMHLMKLVPEKCLELF